MLPESTSVLPEAAPHRGPRLRALLKARYGTIALAAALVGCGSGNDAPSGPIAPPPPPPPLPAVGDLRVIVTTTGEDPDPDGYTLTLDETETRTIGINTTTTFVGLSPGSHSVRLDGIAHNCAAEGTNPVSAQVNQGETASVSLDVGCLFIEGELDFDIADNVPGSAVTVIQAGLDLAEAYLETDYGGGISRRVRDTLTVKIVATGQGNQEVGGGGACCTAFSQSSSGQSVVRPFFDVAHTNWLNRPTFVPWTKAEDQQATVIHEYAHGWQHVLGCISLFDQPLGNWLNEGIAQYVGFQALIAQGAMQAAAVLSFMLSSAKSTGALDKPLEELAPLSSQPWPGHVGYIALDMLVEDAPEGKLAVRTICEEVASGAAVFDAFESAFGIPLAEFYAEFEVWRQSQ